MVRLSQNFDLSEFGRDIPAVCVPTLAILCVEILEPIREHVNAPLYITSGYRSPATNTAAHGQSNSEHMATADYCACDFYSNDVVKVFDWLRNEPTIPYHQCILEKGKLGYVIHISFNKTKPGVRSVLVGATHNSEKYQEVPYVQFNPTGEVSA